MRAAWGYDQSGQPSGKLLQAPGMRLPVVTTTHARDPRIPDGDAMPEHVLNQKLMEMRKYAMDMELNLTHTFQVAPHITPLPRPPSLRHELSLTHTFHAGHRLRYRAHRSHALTPTPTPTPSPTPTCVAPHGHAHAHN